MLRKVTAICFRLPLLHYTSTANICLFGQNGQNQVGKCYMMQTLLVVLYLVDWPCSCFNVALLTATTIYSRKRRTWRNNDWEQESWVEISDFHDVSQSLETTVNLILETITTNLKNYCFKDLSFSFIRLVILKQWISYALCMKKSI